MDGVECPYCHKKIYSAFWERGKVKCIYCGKEFLVTYDQPRQIWIAKNIFEDQSR